MVSSEAQKLIDQIRSDNTSGATALTHLAAKALAARTALPEIARALVAAQPAMAPILNLANSVLWAWEGGRTVPAAASEACLTRFTHNTSAAVGHAARLIEDGQTIQTHSFSQAVLDTLRSAHHRGRRFEVICTESRPMLEGAALARELGDSGIPVTLVVDAAMLSALDRADLVLVGADSVSSLGVMNKMGTDLLAEAAAGSRMPVYAVCTSEKFLPAGYVPPEESPKPANEVSELSFAAVTVENFYFVRTSLDRFSGLVTEEGVLTPQQVVQRLSERELHPALVSGTSIGS